jgi:hypothetical protein
VARPVAPLRLRRERLRVIGKHGSWFAGIAGEDFPCIHKHWFSATGYNDPDLKPGDAQSEELVAALRHKSRAILTSDEPHFTEGQAVGFKRTGYIALFRVDKIEFDQGGLRLKFVERLADLV